MTNHAILSPSSYSRWSQCAAAPRLEAQAAPDRGSAAAARGTKGHENAQAVLDGIPPESLNWDDAQQQADVMSYVDYVRYASGSHEVHTEVRLPLTWLTDEMNAWGTADAVIVAPELLEVVDLKLGRYAVDVAGNGQLMMYLAAAVARWGLREQLRITICQPSTGFANSSYNVSQEELDQFITRVKAAAKRTRQPDAAPRPSDSACQWCRAKSFCPALREKVESALAVKFCDPSLDSAMALLPQVEAWVKATRDQAMEHLKAGGELQGWTLTAARRLPAKWANSQAANTFLKNSGVPMELPTPSAVKKMHVDIPANLLAPEEFGEPSLKKI